MISALDSWIDRPFPRKGNMELKQTVYMCVSVCKE